jgi:hypothetical protein
LRARWLNRLGLGEGGSRHSADLIGQGTLTSGRGVKVDQRGALGVLPHPGHEFFGVRAASAVSWLPVCRSYGYSWAEIGSRLGITRQAAHQRWAASS